MRGIAVGREARISIHFSSLSSSPRNRPSQSRGMSNQAILCTELPYLAVLGIVGWEDPFNGPLSRATWVSQYQKGKTSLDFTEARDSEWQWHQLGHVQVCTSLPDR